MFRRCSALPPVKVTVFIEGHPVTVGGHESVAGAMLSAGHHYTRFSMISGQPRSPYCMMGICFECVVEIDGVPNQQACMTPVREGMRIRLQRGARALNHESRL